METYLEIPGSQILTLSGYYFPSLSFELVTNPVCAGGGWLYQRLDL